MKLNIEVEASSFEKVIQNGLENLPKEELHDILKQVIMEAFTKSPTLQGALIKETGDYYHKRIELGPLAEAAVKDIDFGPELDKIKQIMLDDLLHNHREILEGAMLQALTKHFVDSTAFSSMLEMRIQQVFHDLREKGGY